MNSPLHTLTDGLCHDGDCPGCLAAETMRHVAESPWYNDGEKEMAVSQLMATILESFGKYVPA